MFIKKDELERRKSIANNLLMRLNIPNAEAISSAPLDTTKFKFDGTETKHPRFTPGLRAIIGASAIASSPAKAAEIFDCSESYASTLARAPVDLLSGEGVNQELKDSIYEELRKIRETAQSKLMLALGLIDKDNLDAIGLKDRARLAAQIANQLSQVIDRTIQKGPQNDSRSAHLHLYSPDSRPLDAFKIINIPSNASESEK